MCDLHHACLTRFEPIDSARHLRERCKLDTIVDDNGSVLEKAPSSRCVCYIRYDHCVAVDGDNAPRQLRLHSVFVCGLDRIVERRNRVSHEHHPAYDGV